MEEKNFANANKSQNNKIIVKKTIIKSQKTNKNNIIQSIRLDKIENTDSFPPKKRKTKNTMKRAATENPSKKNNTTKESISNNINDKYKKILEYNEYELNSLSYKEALRYDKRSFTSYYFSLLRKNQLLFFAFYPNKDYNSQIIKIILFFFFFASNLMINALFFNDNTMHKIYVDSGKFNLNYQIPHIVYSFLINFVINLIIKNLALSEKKIISLKQVTTIKNIDEQKNELFSKLKRNFFLFFVIAFIFLSLFCYYISCFCGIYINTQIHLIKDSVIGFGLSLLYPFIIYLIPGLLRISSLHAEKADKECRYNFSKIFQAI